jgi:hypothetical protein
LPTMAATYRPGTRSWMANGMLGGSPPPATALMPHWRRQLPP